MFNYQNYIDDVINKNIIICESVRLAVERHISDLKKVSEDNYLYYFDSTEAERPIIFIQNLSHTKGKWASDRLPIKLEPWQQFIIASVFGWRKKSDTLRRFRKCYVQVARKNGKTTMLSGIGNYSFFCDSPREAGVEVYYIATKKEQAKIAWEESERQIRKSKALNKLATTYKQNTRIVKKSDTASKCLVLGKDSKSEDGLNPHFIGVDEYHAHPNNELLNVLESGTGARTQPLTFIITTAGFNKNAVCYEEYQYLKNILKGTIENDEYFAMIFEPDETDDWKSDEAIYKSNPNINISVNLDYIKARVKEASDKPHLQTDVKTKNLNVWTQSSSVWISKEVWDSGNNKIDVPSLAGQKCYIGLDLATTRDIAAYSLCFTYDIDDNNNFILQQRFFMPAENIRERSREEKVPYELWAEQGYITLCPGDTINFDMIENSILDDSKLYEVVDISYDPWKAIEIVTHLTDEGFQMTGIRQSFSVGGLSEGTGLFEKAIYENKIIHGDNPVLNWMLSCTEVRTDGRDNYLPMKPDRRKNSKRIDGVVSSIMALHSCVRNSSDSGSVYDNEGVLVL